MTSYLTSIDTFFLSRTVFEIFDFKVFGVWPWPLTFKGHLGSKIFSLFESPYMTSYLTSIDTFSLSRAVFKKFDFKGFRVWPWPLTFRGQLGSKKIPPFESPYMTSYLTSINTFFLSRTVFEIFDFKVFSVWPWPLTFRGHLRSKIFHTIRKFIHDFLSNFYRHFLSISYLFRDIRLQSFYGFDLDLWPLEVTWGQKYFTIIRKPIHDFLSNFYRHFLSISYRFRDIRLQSFLGFDLDLWPLKVTWGRKIFSLFESSYMTSYLTSIDTFFLSRTVFKIFDFKGFRVWPWPLTFRGHLGSKIFSPFESSYMTSYLTSIDTFFLSRTVFEIFDFKVFRFDLDLWPLEVTWGQKYFHHSKAHTWLPI